MAETLVLALTICLPRHPVLQLPQSSNLWYQKYVGPYPQASQIFLPISRALLTSELETIFASAPQAPNALANSRVRDAFARATGKAVSSSNSESGAKKRLPGPGDDCPICYEDMHHADEKTLTFCETCGNALHTECFNQCTFSVLTSGAFADVPMWNRGKEF